MNEFMPVLENCALFAGIRREDIAGMLGCLNARTVEVARGGAVFREGDSAVYIGILLAGKLHLAREDYFGNRSILAHIGAGELFGESYAFSAAGTLPVSVVAEADSRVLLLDSRRITSPCAKACWFHSRMTFNLLGIVSEKNRLLHQKIEVTSKRTTREKLMAYLLLQAKAAGSSTFTVPYDRQALADYLEVDRSGLSAEISKLRREGVLECERSTFKLK